MTGLTVVCGPPLAGKTTHALAHASDPGRVVDLDLIAVSLGSPVDHGHDRSVAAAARAVWLNRAADAIRDPDAETWLVRSLPSSLALAELRTMGLTTPVDVVELWPDRDLLFSRVPTRADQAHQRGILSAWLKRHRGLATRAPNPVKWGGRRAADWTAAVLARNGTRCWLRLPGCTGLATTGDHIIPKIVRPDLAFDVDNGRPSCRSCNSRRGEKLDAEIDDRAFFETVASPRCSSRSLSPLRHEENESGSARSVKYRTEGA